MSAAGISLIDQAEALNQPPSWRASAVQDVAERLSDFRFPCIFSRNAFKKGTVQFVLVDQLGTCGMQALAAALEEFVRGSRDWDGRVDSARPLVVIFSRSVTGERTLDGYHDFGWDVLQRLHALDPGPWPDAVSLDPQDPSWSMCFAGMPLFVNMSTPAHSRRRSRHLGRCFAFVVNPRERFDVLAGDTPRGRKTRETIRRRVDRYDDVPHSPDLAAYGSGATEWQQYEVLDDNASTHRPRCPFRHHADAPSTTQASTASTKETHP
jgi:N-omega-hydroxy-L-arginine synthase